MKVPSAKLNTEQAAQIEKWAQDFLILEPQDRIAAIATISAEYAKAVRTAYPDLPQEKIKSAVMRLSNLILKRFNELKATISSEGGRA